MSTGAASLGEERPTFGTAWRVSWLSHRRDGCQNWAATSRLDCKRAPFSGAAAAGFATDPETCLRVAQLTVSRFDVGYHVDHSGRLGHFLGVGSQEPNATSH